MEKESILKSISDLYTNNLSQHGPNSKSVGWKNSESQYLRFEKLAEVIDKNQEAITINDLGCGYGEMFRFLDRRLSGKLKKYYGYDISEAMINVCQNSITDSRSEFFISSDAKLKADYSIISGIFNVKMKTSDTDWETYIKDTLRGLSGQSRRGLAFNLLSSYVDWKEDILYYADPFVYFDFCKRYISQYVSLLHDYPLYEWTILVKFEESIL